MKKIFKTLPLALIVMSIYSCTSDDETVQDVNDNSSVVTTFTCTQENEGTTTKAAMGPEGKTILWKTGDAISIFDGDGNNQFTLKTESDGQNLAHLLENVTNLNLTLLFIHIQKELHLAMIENLSAI